MAIIPKRVKFRKQQRGRMKGKSTRGSRLAYGEYGLKAIEPGWVTTRQIEAARIAVTRHIKRGGRIWINLVCDKPVSKKPAETRQGKGKGNPEFWVAVVKPGKIMFELEGVSHDVAKEAFRLASYKLPIKTRFVSREDFLGGM